MSQSTRSSRRALKQVGSGSSVNLFSALPVGAGRLPRPHRLSKAAKRRLKWLDYRKTHTIKQTCLHFDIPRSTLNRWQKRFDPHNLASLEDRSSRPQTVRQPDMGSTGSGRGARVAATVSALGQGKTRHLARSAGHSARRLNGWPHSPLSAPASVAHRASISACNAACPPWPPPRPTQTEGRADPERVARRVPSGQYGGD